MGDYRLTCTIAIEAIIEAFQEGKVLCCAFGVASSDDDRLEYNVVAWTSSPDEIIRIDWNETYAISRSDAPFEDGAFVQASTEQTDISFGQTYTVEANFTSGSETDNSAPKSGFKFHNNATDDVAVIWKEVRGRRRAIHVSRGSERFHPKVSIAVWFERDMQIGTMVGKLPEDSIVVDMNGREATVFYDGRWRIESN